MPLLIAPAEPIRAGGSKLLLVRVVVSGGGRLYRFLVDPGSPFTSVAETVIRERELFAVPGEYVPIPYCVDPVAGEGAVTRRTPKLRADSLLLRGCPGLSPAAVVIPMPWFVRLDWFDVPGIDGTLGMNAFERFASVSLDLRADRIELRW